MTTIWERLCQEPESEENTQKLIEIRKNMNTVLLSSAELPEINTGDNEQNDICEDIAAIVRAYTEWFERTFPDCINSTTFGLENISDLGFGELLIVPYPNNPDLYHCFSVSDIVDLASTSRTGSANNPYNRQPLPGSLLRRAHIISTIMANDYLDITPQLQENDIAPELTQEQINQLQRLEDLLRQSRPNLPDLRENLESIDRSDLGEILTHMTEVIDNEEMLSRPLGEMGLGLDDENSPTVESAEDFAINYALPLAEIEDENSEERRLKLIAVLYPQYSMQILGYY